jgi:hypothetical protein
MKTLIVTLFVFFSQSSLAIFRTIMLEDEISKKACSKDIEIISWNEEPIKEVCLITFNNEWRGLYVWVISDSTSRYYKIEMKDSTVIEGSYFSSGDLVFHGTINDYIKETSNKKVVSPYVLANQGEGPKARKAFFLETDFFKVKNFKPESLWF